MIASGAPARPESPWRAGTPRPRPARRTSIDLRVGQDLDLLKTTKKLELKLNPQEQKICDVLVEVTEHLKQEHPELEPVTLRIAGGWVRDKLLGIDSHDIDVAIDTMKGFDFAEHVNKFLEKKGFETKHIGKITANPDKSKHLETATARILEHDVDFVNLRSETYTEHSRVPIIDHATPEEDAMRRDITINALFYNMHTRQVEDLTGHGLSDLAQGLVRTPLPAIQTFLDDPLRVLRVIRFASRFNYDLAEDIPEAIQDERIRKSLKIKISKERIGEEVRKMLKSRHPLRAVRAFHDLNLYPVIFVPPPNVNDPDPESGLQAAEYLYTFLSSRVSLTEQLQKIRSSITEAEKTGLFLATELLPFKGITYLEKKREAPAARYVIKDSLKLSNAEADVTVALLEAVDKVPTVVDAVAGGEEDRVQIGLLIRDLGSRPLLERWPTAIIMAMIAEVVRVHPAQDESFEFAIPVLEKYERFLAAVDKLNLGRAWEMKPLLDGQEIAATAGIKAGPALKTLIDDLIKWQLSHPEGTPTEAQAWLAAKFSGNTG